MSSITFTASTAIALLLALGAAPAASQAAPPEESPSVDDEGLRVRVRPGDTLAAFSRWYRVPIEALTQLNGIQDPHRLFAGQRLRVPAAPLRRHTVAPGETLSALAASSETIPRELARLNGLPAGTVLAPGTELRLPHPAASGERAAPAHVESPPTSSQRGESEPAARRARPDTQPGPIRVAAAPAEAPPPQARPLPPVSSPPPARPALAAQPEVQPELRLDPTPLSDVWGAYYAARFEDAGALAEAFAGELAERRQTPGVRALRARVELAAAASRIAVDQREAALAHLRVALALDPELELDAEDTSPKILALLQLARDTRGP